MKILHLSSGISSQSAAFRLHKALLDNNIESIVYSGNAAIADKTIVTYSTRISRLFYKIRSKIEYRFIHSFLNEGYAHWSSGSYGSINLEFIKKIDPDIIHLHWINGFLSIKELTRLNKPIVWTFHDSWAFTGGCHLPLPCLKYETECSDCPQLKKTTLFDPAKRVFLKKTRRWKKRNIDIICPSQWMLSCVSKSFIFSGSTIHNIPNCIDTDFYQPVDKMQARSTLKLPLQKKIILFGANNATKDKNKGYSFLHDAFREIKKETKAKDVELVIFGSSDIGWDEEKAVRFLGNINDPAILKLLYAAADVIVNASITENFSNVILESLACGTPVVAFDTGGNSDLIRDGFNGKLAPLYDVKALGDAILFVLEKEFDPREIHAGIVEKFSNKPITQRHMNLYMDILSKNKMASR